MQTSRASIPEDRGQFATRAGDVVRIRSQRWHVLDVQSFEHCQLITVRGTSAGNAALTRHFLLPFETVRALNQQPSLRFVSARLWRRGFRTVLATHTPPGSLRAAGPARINLMPHQLEPALAVIRGLGARVLLADDVGLGKTIQAGLIISELETRGLAERVLIPDAGRVARAVGRRAVHPIWDQRNRRRFSRCPAAGCEPAPRLEPVVYRSPRHCINRLRQAARNPEVGAHVPVGHSGRR